MNLPKLPRSAPRPRAAGREAQAPPTSRESTRSLIRSFLIVSAIIILTELTIMVVLEPLFGDNHLSMAFVDAGTLILVCFPCMYFMLVKPMVHHLTAKAETEWILSEMSTLNELLRHDAEAKVQAAAEERSQAHERIQLQANILAAVQQAVIATGKGGAILFWNQYATRMFGWSQEEIQNQTLAKVTGFTDEVMRGGLLGLGGIQPWSGEVKAVRRDGSQFPALLTASALLRRDGSVAGLVYTFIDISERKQAEAAVRESEEKYSTVVEHSPTGIFIYRQGQLRFGNQRFFRMTGRSSSELTRLDPAGLFHPEDWPAVREMWQKCLAGTGTFQDYECRMITAQGAIRWISGRTSLIRYEGVPSILANIQDITEKHLAEEALRASRETLHRLSTRLMSAQESERQRVARELHDSIGQSLSAAKFMVERAIHEEAGDPEHKSIRAVVPVLQASVEEVRRISMALRPSTLDDLGLLATIAWFAREFQATYPHIRVERVVEVEEFEVPEEIRTNAFRIIQEAMNNAAKHSRGTRIVVALRQVLGEFQVVVGDDGLGFDLLAPPSHQGHGGFGLASMRERAELFGGSLIVTSSPGEGTMIMARWPIADDLTS